MAVAVKADVVLQQLSTDFERSKSEQIFRFLRDQEFLNHEESQSIVTSDLSDSPDDVSDTETLLNQRLDLHRVRPQSAKGWQVDHSPRAESTQDMVCVVGENIAAPENGFIRPARQDFKGKDNVLYKSIRERSLPRDPVLQCSECPSPASPEDSPLLSRKPSFRHRNLRVAKLPPTATELIRPRTAARSSRSKMAITTPLNIGMQDETSDIQTQRLRNSAPASLSRQHKSDFDGDCSYLRMGDSAGQSLTPRHGKTSNPKSNHAKLDNIISQPNKPQSYSKVRPEQQFSAQSFELPVTPMRRPKETTRKSRGDKFMTSLKFPPLT